MVALGFAQVLVKEVVEAVKVVVEMVVIVHVNQDA